LPAIAVGHPTLRHLTGRHRRQAALLQGFVIIRSSLDVRLSLGALPVPEICRGTGSKPCKLGLLETTKVADFAAAARQIAGKRAPTERQITTNLVPAPPPIKDIHPDPDPG
jgi:hypothetical protein